MKMFIYILLFTLVHSESEWNQFKLKYNKIYHTIEEENKRKQIFQSNLKKLQIHNKENNHYSQGINWYSDYDDNELIQFSYKTGIQRFHQWKTVHKRRQFHLNNTNSLKHSQNKQNNKTLPSNYSLCTSESEFNYCGTLNIDQGSCGCCYAAGTAHHLSTLYSFLIHQQNKHNQSKIERKLFSVQQLIDCNQMWGGCGGGFAEFCLESNDEFILDEDYPFIDSSIQCESPDDCQKYRHECKKNTSKFKAPLKLKDLKKRYTYFSQVSWEEIKEIIYKYHGFISAMKVSPSLYRYSGGIYKDESCQNKITDHVVVVDGYGESGNTKYLWVRNSWGKDWGIENGHFKIDFDTLCGINNRDEYGYQNNEILYLENNLYFEVELTQDTFHSIHSSENSSSLVSILILILSFILLI